MAYSKEYYQKNREKMIESAQKWTEENREKVRGYFNKYYYDRKGTKEFSDRNRKAKAKYRQSVKGKISEYRKGAKDRGIDFLLTDNEFLSLWGKPCVYCGAEIKTIGIDRVDSKKGYCLDNVVACCGICNTGKMQRTHKEFFRHIYNIVKFYQNKENLQKLLDNIKE